MTKSLLFFVIMGLGLASGESTDKSEVAAVIKQFESGLNNRDLSSIEKVVAEDLIAFENGHRNDGWADFRDNHLVPEMKEPMPHTATKLVKVVTAPTMAWAYSRTGMSIGPPSQKVSVELWSVYVLERRANQWKIVLLDWSIRKVKGH